LICEDAPIGLTQNYIGSGAIPFASLREAAPRSYAEGFTQR